MSTNYNGDGTIPQATAPATIAISSSTNTNPIVVTTATNHGYATGDTVLIEGHKVNTSADGLRVVTVLASNTFSIPVAGVGVGGATGTVTDYAVNPLIAVPSGGDTRNASSVSSPMEALANTTPYLFERTGAYRLHNIARLAFSDAMDAATWSTTSVASTVWTALTSASWAYTFPLLSRDVNVINTDILVVRFSSLARLNFAAVTTNGLALGADFGSGTSLVGATAIAWDAAFKGAVTIVGTLFAKDFTATSLNSVTLKIMGFNSAVANQTIELVNPYHIDVFHYRSNA